MFKLLLFVAAIASVTAGSDSPCVLKATVTSPYIKEYCAAINGSLILACCYLEANGTFAAIDLSGANLTSVPRLYTLHNFADSVFLMDLRLNPLLTSWQQHDFFNMTNLNELIISNTLACPGGENAWESIQNLSKENAIQCLQQKDICRTLVSPCPDKASFCSPSGPNQYSCFCTSNYYGYKCLRSGHFPWTVLLAPTGAVTVVASALLFFTQRRHVKK